MIRAKKHIHRKKIGIGSTLKMKEIGFESALYE
jgi:hypothetical protein